MSNKLNLSAIEKYSKNYAAKLCDAFFSSNSVISGKQILTLSSVQQVNLLTIKSLYEKWQAETQRLRSPYFDFNSDEVQQALKVFMNTVSQFISVKRENFEPLLIDSVGETLVLLLEPQTFYKELMRDLPNFKFSQTNIAPVSKYILINKDILPKLLLKLNGQEFVFVNQAMNWVDEIPFVAENPDKYLAQFAEILPIPHDLILGGQTSPPPITESSSSKSFFDLELPNTPIAVERPAYIPEIKVETPPTPPIEPPSIYQQKIEAITEAISDKTSTKEQDSVRLNEKLAGEHKSLNDQIHSSSSLLDYHRQNRIEGIAGAISLNQRYLFTNHLFGGNIQAFSHALEELELCKDFGEAKELILKKYVPRYMWAITSAEAEEFFEIVKRRFS